MVKYRIWQERASFPICSEYLQALCELAVTLGGEDLLDGLSEVEVPGVFQLPNFLEKEVDTQLSRVLTHPDELDGLVLTDDGWQTWTGTITQHEIGWSKPTVPPSSGRGFAEKQDAPPALLPGRRVIRRSAAVAAAAAAVTAAAARPSRVVRRSSGEQQTRDSDAEEASASSPSASSPTPSSPVPAPMLGTITDIVAWEGEPFGGRTVEWDDGTTEVVNWTVNRDYEAFWSKAPCSRSR